MPASASDRKQKEMDCEHMIALAIVVKKADIIHGVPKQYVAKYRLSCHVEHGSNPDAYLNEEAEAALSTFLQM